MIIKMRSFPLLLGAQTRFVFISIVSIEFYCIILFVFIFLYSILQSKESISEIRLFKR